MVTWQLRKAQLSDLEAVKTLFDAHRRELGFVRRPSVAKSIGDDEVIVAVIGDNIIGAIHYHLRRDGQTTLYHIAVDANYRRAGVGAALLAELRAHCLTNGAGRIMLKCPAELPANDFYSHRGFQKAGVEEGKYRSLNVWILQVDNSSLS